MKNSEKKLKAQNNDEEMSYPSQKIYEFHMQKKNKLNKKKKNKRNLKKAIEISHTQQTNVVDGFYEVEHIEKIKSFGKYDLKFYIKWKGWSESDNTWEPFQNVRNCFYNLRELYERYRDNKKITNSDAWKMYIGCLEREKLLDGDGNFRDSFKRKYTKRKKLDSNGELNEDFDRAQKGLGDDSSGQESDLSGNYNHAIKQKLKRDEQKSINSDNEEESHVEGREHLQIKKKITKKKKVKQGDDEKAKGGDNVDENGVKKKRKYRTKKYLAQLEREKQAELAKKGKKFKRTHSSILSKQQKKPKSLEQSKLEAAKFIPPEYPDIEPKIEEGEEEGTPNLDKIFKQQGGNFQNRVASNNKIDNQTDKTSKEGSKSSQNSNSQDHQDTSSSDQSQHGEDNTNNDSASNHDQQGGNGSESSQEDNDSKDNFGEEDDENEDEEEEDEEEDEDDDEEEGDDDEEEEESSSHLKARGFSAMNGKESQKNIDGEEIEPKISKKRKNDIHGLNSSQNLNENKPMLNSLQELDLIQNSSFQRHQRLAFGGSNHNITSDVLGNSDLNEMSLLHQKNKKYNQGDYIVEEGSISGGKNLLHSFDHLNQDHLLSEQFLDKSNNHDYSLKGSSYFADHSKNPVHTHPQTNQSCLIKFQNYKAHWSSTTLPLADLQQQQIEFGNGSAFERILKDQNGRQIKYDDCFRPYIPNEDPQFFSQEQCLYANKNQADLSVTGLQNNRLITIYDRSNDDDIFIDTEHQYKLDNEKQDKDKQNKIRLIKKNDSVQIQHTQPYKHHSQYQDDLQKKRVNPSNYNDVHGQMGGHSKSLQEYLEYNRAEVKQQQQKMKKDKQNGLSKQSSSQNAISSNNINQLLNEQSYEQILSNEYQKVKDLTNQDVKDPAKSIASLYRGNFSLKDEPNRIIAMDVHPFLVDQYIFKVTWAPRKKKDQLISSWVEGEKLKQKYPQLVIEFYESFIRFID